MASNGLQQFSRDGSATVAVEGWTFGDVGELGGHGCAGISGPVLGLPPNGVQMMSHGGEKRSNCECRQADCASYVWGSFASVESDLWRDVLIFKVFARD